MTPEYWLQELTTASPIEESSLPLFTALLKPVPQNLAPELQKLVSDAKDAMIAHIFQKAVRNETFGNIDRVEKTFGSSLEQNYGVKSGPFLSLARAYWTFKIEMDDLIPEHTTLLLTQILIGAEQTVAGVFFPTPGPMTIPVRQRREGQALVLRQYAPEMDVERFLAENPLLRQKGCVGMLLLLFLPVPLLLECFWKA